MTAHVTDIAGAASVEDHPWLPVAGVAFAVVCWGLGGVAVDGRVVRRAVGAAPVGAGLDEGGPLAAPGARGGGEFLSAASADQSA